MVTDLDQPWFDGAGIDSNPVPSEFVAPWRYPAHNMAGMRNGWEAPRTHVGPYVQGETVDVLMGGLTGSDAARHQFEAAHTPEETEAVSAALLTTPGQHLGDPLDYGAYLMGQLTGHWTQQRRRASMPTITAPLRFNLDATAATCSAGTTRRAEAAAPAGKANRLPTPGPTSRAVPPDPERLLERGAGRPQRRPHLVGTQSPWQAAALRPEGQSPSPVALRRPEAPAHHYLHGQPAAGAAELGQEDLQVTEAEMAAGHTPSRRRQP
jgi:hypothetical protein